MNIKKTIKLNQHHGYYFPLFNFNGMRSAIAPSLQGDLKLDQHHYAIEPISELDLYQLSKSRNVIFNIDGTEYHLNGSRANQQSDELSLEVGILYHHVERKHSKYQMDITSIVAINDDVELHEVTYKNVTDQIQKVKMTVAIPMYGRSADNIRDHRHVTSLLNRIYTHEFSIENKPTLLFNEKGHFTNDMSYAVIAKSKDANVLGFIPTIDDFINEGTFEYPRGLDKLTDKNKQIDGYECFGGIQFETIDLSPNQEIKLYVGVAINESFDENDYNKYLSEDGFSKALEEVKFTFNQYLKSFNFEIENEETSNQLKWVALQPLLRRYYGNSFLPHHDYGHGGKGWRDLWQDLLAMIFTGESSVFNLLYDNFAGVRVDGSNATIIGEKPGEFIADRNSITRVWSDHGAWPLITVKMYIDETNDCDFLLKKQSYFFDQFTHYTHKTNSDIKKNDYQGTILEHLLLQNLVPIHHLGHHGYIKLEDADWNDGLDMAKAKGETIAFTHMYLNNLRVLVELIKDLNVEQFELFESLMQLLNTNADLEFYFNEVEQFNEKTVFIEKETLIDHLVNLYEPRIKDLQERAFQFGRYEAYYDQNGHLLDTKDTVNLTGQAMALLSNIATKEQALSISKVTKEKLFEPHIGGYHLNNVYDSHMGRAFQFAYNHKENGAVFSHMAVMYAHGLYQYDLVNEARDAAFALLHQAQNLNSGVLVGIPEYFTEKGVGKYSYLTGSASWMLKLIRNEVFGIQMKKGQCFLNPKLLDKDFINRKASITTVMNNKQTTITYLNPKSLNFGAYKVISIKDQNKELQQGFKEFTGTIEVLLG